MRSKVILTVGVLTLILGGVVLYFIGWQLLQFKPAVHSIDKKGIYVGGGKSGLEQPGPDDASRYAQTVKNLNEGWKNVGIGDAYFKSGAYEKAIEAYKQAYEVDPGNRLFTGQILIGAYEKLSRYDEAIALVDEILETQRLVEYGVEKYTALRVRLVAARNQSQANS